MADQVSSEIVIDAAPDDILAVLHDFESYPDWAKAVKSVRVVKSDRKGRATQVEFEVTPGPLPKVRYVLGYSYAANKLSWDLVEGDLKDMMGAYVLQPQNGSTKVTFELVIELGVGLPIPGFIKNRAAREITRV